MTDEMSKEFDDKLYDILYESVASTIEWEDRSGYVGFAKETWALFLEFEKQRVKKFAYTGRIGQVNSNIAT